MPDLSTTIHTDMLERGRNLGLADKSQARIYGDHWGDPQVNPVMRFVRDRYIRPFATPDATVCEIGPGGGRWTRYFLGCKQVYAVDYYQPLLDELGRNFASPMLQRIKNNGTDFPGVPDASCDLVFSFGVFVHLDFDIVEQYVQNIRRICKPHADIIIQYADSNKPAAQKIESFAENTQDRMRACIRKNGYVILEEVNELVNHSAMVRFTPKFG